METRTGLSLRTVESEHFLRSEKSAMLQAAQKDPRVRGIEVRRVKQGKWALILAYDIQQENHL